MAKIALKCGAACWGIPERASHNPPHFREIASGEGWTASDVVCTAGPRDRPFEEQHLRPSIAIVVSGTFQYRASASGASSAGSLMVPGAFLLGSPGQCFTCGHEYGTGDRCISFAYDPDFFERLAHDTTGRATPFTAPRLPPIQALASLVAKGSGLIATPDRSRCEELAIQVAARALQVERGIEPHDRRAKPSSFARVTQVIRMMESDADVPGDLSDLARLARLSPYYFLRIFEELTGVTPHQYVLRTRLRRASIRLLSEKTKISEIALDCGFGDISNFNHAFRAEFGMSPRQYRRIG